MTTRHRPDVRGSGPPGDGEVGRVQEDLPGLLSIAEASPVGPRNTPQETVAGLGQNFGLPG